MGKTAAPDRPRSGFQGFAPGALDFFTELAAHQDRDWFQAHQARYVETVREPLERLVASLSLAFAAHDIPLTGDPKASLFRIHRDVRFSKDKRPYKTHASAVLTRDGSKRSQGLVYVQLGPGAGPGACFVAAGFHALEPGELDRFRRRILARRADWSAVEAGLAAAGLSLSRDDAAVRLPRGYDAQTVGALAETIRLKSFTVRQALDPGEVSTPVLIDRIVTFAAAAQPLLRFGWAALAPGG